MCSICHREDSNFKEYIILYHNKTSSAVYSPIGEITELTKSKFSFMLNVLSHKTVSEIIREKVSCVVRKMIEFHLKWFEECLVLLNCGFNNKQHYDKNSSDFKLMSFSFKCNKYTVTHTLHICFHLKDIYSMIDHIQKC